MNEQTVQLIEKLASKLGTTSEYLWGVLIKQAPISATINLVYFVFVILAGVGLYKLHKRFCKEVEGGDSIYSEGEEAVVVPMVIGVIIWIIIALITFFSLGDVFNGFANPEYWALKEVLDAANN